jgi:uncharacterized protein (TIRG00374 family)
MTPCLLAVFDVLDGGPERPLTEETQTKKKNSRGKILTQWALGVLLILLLLCFGDLSQLPRLSEIDGLYVFLMFVATLGFTVSHNFRWEEIVRGISKEKRNIFFPLFRYLVNSYALGTVIPMDASLLGVRSFYLTRSENIPLSMALFSVLLDRFLDFVILLVMILPSLLFVTGAASMAQAGLLVLLLVAGLFLMAFWQKGETFHFFLGMYKAVLLKWFHRIPWIGRRVSEGVEEASEASRFDRKDVLRITLWNVVKYLFLSLRFYLTGLALGVDFPLMMSFFALPLVQLSGLISVTPAGFGIIEMGTYGALLLMEVPKGQILLFVVGQRVLISLMVLGMFALNHLFVRIRSRLTGKEGIRWTE